MVKIYAASRAKYSLVTYMQQPIKTYITTTVEEKNYYYCYNIHYYYLRTTHEYTKNNRPSSTSSSKSQAGKPLYFQTSRKYK